jgi:hypothetical protein
MAKPKKPSKALVVRAREAIGDLYILGLIGEREYHKSLARWAKWSQMDFSKRPFGRPVGA